VSRRSLLVCALTAVAFGAAAPSASAGEAWLWICNGPNGQALTRLGDRAQPLTSAPCNSGARSLPLQTGAFWAFEVPANTTLSQVYVQRRFFLGEGQRFDLSVDGVSIDTATPGNGLSGIKGPMNASGDAVKLEVTCTSVECSDDGGVDVQRLGLRVTDNHFPNAAVKWSSPTARTLELAVDARDLGLGLSHATVYLDGKAVTGGNFSDPACADLSPSSSQIDIPYGLVDQNDNVLTVPESPVGCVGRGALTLPLDVSQVPDGPDHRVVIEVTDHAGNKTVVFDRPTSIFNGGQTVIELPRDPSGPLSPSEDRSCASPRLTMALADDPLRRVRGRAVLRAGAPYRFTGRLTCQGRPAPANSRIEILRSSGRRTATEGATSTVADGNVAVRLSFTGSRTLIFRFTGSDGQRAEARVPLTVERLRNLRAAIRARWLRYETPRDRVRFISIEARNVPRGSAIQIRCAGPGCPGGVNRRASVRRFRGAFSLLRGLGSASLRPGASVRVTITKAGFRGVGKLYCVRSGQRVRTIAYTTEGQTPNCS
jgi:hypothetical protein